MNADDDENVMVNESVRDSDCVITRVSVSVNVGVPLKVSTLCVYPSVTLRVDVSVLVNEPDAKLVLDSENVIDSDDVRVELFDIDMLQV